MKIIDKQATCKIYLLTTALGVGAGVVGAGVVGFGAADEPDTEKA